MLNFREWAAQHAGKAKKDQILNYWNQLPPSMPVQPTKIIPRDYQGSSIYYDGIRVTGTQQFINSVASRLKDLLNYNQGETNLDVRYRQQKNPDTKEPLPNSYIFYAQVRQRGK